MSGVRCDPGARADMGSARGNIPAMIPASLARTPAVDVQMTAQDVGMLRSFSVSLSAMLIVDDG